MNQVPKMPRFNLTNVAVAISLTVVLGGSAGAQVSATDNAAVREHVNKGNYLMGRGAWEQAIAEYEAALDVDAGSIVAKENLVLVHNNWGISLFRQHKFEEAKAQWEEALKMNPYDRNAKQNLQVLKAAMARIIAAPKPAAKPAAEDAAANPGSDGDDGSGSGVRMINKSKPEGNQPHVKQPPVAATSGESSGPKVLNATSATESSGASILKSSKPSEGAGGATSPETSGAALIVNPQSSPVEVPTVPAPPSANPVAPEPPQVSAPPAIDMSSPYSFYTPTTPKPGAEVSSPYVMPKNLPTPVYNTKPYSAPNAVQGKPTSDWTSPLTTQTETPSAAGETESGNLEDQVAAIEVKLTGKKQKNMPILKRIEKLEVSISGKSNSGSLQERIEALKKSCGL